MASIVLHWYSNFLYKYTNSNESKLALHLICIKIFHSIYLYKTFVSYTTETQLFCIKWTTAVSLLLWVAEWSQELVLNRFFRVFAWICVDLFGSIMEIFRVRVWGPFTIVFAWFWLGNLAVVVCYDISNKINTIQAKN